MSADPTRKMLLKGWEEVKPLSNNYTTPAKRYLHTTVLQGRTIWLFGGSDSNQMWCNDLCSFSLDTKEWTTHRFKPSDTTPAAREDHSAIAATASDKMIIFSGHGLDDEVTCFAFDFDEHKWTEVKTSGIYTPQGRTGHSAVYYNDGTSTHGVMIIFGGKPTTTSGRQGTRSRRSNRESSLFLSDMYSLDLGTFEWSKIKPTGLAPIGRRGHSAVVDPIGKRMIVFGGCANNSGDLLNDVHVFDLVSHRWTELTCTGAVPSARERHTAQFYKGKMYVFGGWSSQGTSTNDLYELDLSTKVWSRINTNPSGTSGGTNSTTGSSSSTDSLESLSSTPRRSISLSLNKLGGGGGEAEAAGPAKRHGHSSVMVNSKMYIFGGKGNSNIEYMNDIYEVDLSPSNIEIDTSMTPPASARSTPRSARGEISDAGLLGLGTGGIGSRLSATIIASPRVSDIASEVVTTPRTTSSFLEEMRRKEREMQEKLDAELKQQQEESRRRLEERRRQREEERKQREMERLRREKEELERIEREVEERRQERLRRQQERERALAEEKARAEELERQLRERLKREEAERVAKLEEERRKRQEEEQRRRRELEEQLELEQKEQEERERKERERKRAQQEAERRRREQEEEQEREEEARQRQKKREEEARRLQAELEEQKRQLALARQQEEEKQRQRELEEQQRIEQAKQRILQQQEEERRKREEEREKYLQQLREQEEQERAKEAARKQAIEEENRRKQLALWDLQEKIESERAFLSSIEEQISDEHEQQARFQKKINKQLAQQDALRQQVSDLINKKRELIKTKRIEIDREATLERQHSEYSKIHRELRGKLRKVDEEHSDIIAEIKKEEATQENIKESMDAATRALSQREKLLSRYNITDDEDDAEEEEEESEEEEEEEEESEEQEQEQEQEEESEEDAKIRREIAQLLKAEEKQPETEDDTSQREEDLLRSLEAELEASAQESEDHSVKQEENATSNEDDEREIALLKELERQEQLQQQQQQQQQAEEVDDTTDKEDALLKELERQEREEYEAGVAAAAVVVVEATAASTTEDEEAKLLAELEKGLAEEEEEEEANEQEEATVVDQKEDKDDYDYDDDDDAREAALLKELEHQELEQAQAAVVADTEEDDTDRKAQDLERELEAMLEQERLSEQQPSDAPDPDTAKNEDDGESNKEDALLKELEEMEKAKKAQEEEEERLQRELEIELQKEEERRQQEEAEAERHAALLKQKQEEEEEERIRLQKEKEQREGAEEQRIREQKQKEEEEEEARLRKEKEEAAAAAAAEAEAVAAKKATKPSIVVTPAQVSFAAPNNDSITISVSSPSSSRSASPKASSAGSPTTTTTTTSSSSRKLGDDLVIQDEAHTIQIMKDFVDDNTETNWLVFSIVGKALTLKAKGNNGLDELLSFLEDNEVLFAFYRVYLKENDYGFLPKFAFISWTGKSVKAIQKARFLQQSIAVGDFASKVFAISAKFEISGKNEITEEMLKQKCAGAKVQGNGSVSAVDLSEGVAGSDAAAAAAAAAAAKANRRRSATFGGKKAELIMSDEALNLLKAIRDDNSDVTWVCFGFDTQTAAGQTTPLVLGHGKGELDECAPMLKDDEFAFIFLQLVLKEHDYGFVPKVIMITWVGPNIKPIDKAKATTNNLLLQEYVAKIMQIHAKFEFFSKDDISEKRIKTKLAGGTLNATTTTTTTTTTSTTRARSHTGIMAGSSSAAGGGGGSTPKFGGNHGQAKLQLAADEGEMRKLFDKLADVNSNEVNWIIFGFDSGAPDTAHIVAYGSGGVFDIAGHLKNDRYNFILYRMIDESASKAEGATGYKIAFIQWQGPDVGGFGPARCSRYRVLFLEHLKSLMMKVSGEYYAFNIDEIIDEAKIKKKIFASGTVVVVVDNNSNSNSNNKLNNPAAVASTYSAADAKSILQAKRAAANRGRRKSTAVRRGSTNLLLAELDAAASETSLELPSEERLEELLKEQEELEKDPEYQHQRRKRVQSVALSSSSPTNPMARRAGLPRGAVNLGFGNFDPSAVRRSLKKVDNNNNNNSSSSNSNSSNSN